MKYIRACQNFLRSRSGTIPRHKDMWLSFVDSYAPTSRHTDYLKVLHTEFPSLT